MQFAWHGSIRKEKVAAKMLVETVAKATGKATNTVKTKVTP